MASPGRSWTRARISPASIACAAFLLLCLAISIASALVTRDSFFDGEKVLQDIDSVPYLLSYRRDPRLFDPEVDHPAILSMTEVEKQADLIVLATATEDRTTGQRAIVTDVTIDRVLKGDAQPGEKIAVLETVQLRKSDEEVVGESGIQAMPDANYLNGFTLMDASQSYLLFLCRIERDSVAGTPLGGPVCMVLNSPYSRISTARDLGVYVVPDTDIQSVPTGDLHDYNIIVPNEDVARVYREEADEIVQKYLKR